ncbi:MAG: protein kinase [Gemmatimonadaceae bacterium]
MTSPDAEFIDLQGALAGQFSLERELGRGGMGIVYLAREVQLERPVAIKMLPPALSARADLRERFMREARTAAKLSHPNIVPIFQVDDVGGFVFIVMAFVDGETLTQRVRRMGPLPPHEASRLIQEIAWALAYAHARGVIHRDIKPDNIMIERGSARAFVTDFGIAHASDTSALTEMGQVMGTAHYMSPEQAAGEPLDGRSDLYSLGVVAHFALTGQLPFDGPTVQSILAKHLTQPPPPVASVNPAVPRSLAQAVDRALAKQPDARYASGEALAEAITLAVGARHDTPAPVRVWLSKGESALRLYAVWEILIGFPAVAHPSWATPLIVLAPIVIHIGLETYQTRRVLAAGYAMDDLKAAIADYCERRREELAFEYARPSILARVVRVLAYTGLVVAAGTAVVSRTILARFPWQYVAVVFGVSAGTALVGGVIGLRNPGRHVTKRDHVAELRRRFWNSALGARMAKVAQWRLRASTSGALMAHRPTELAIGLAAADLYAALPKPTQRELQSLPDTVKRLEGEAQALRKRVEELGDKLAELGTIGDPQSSGRSAVLEQYGAASDGVDERRRAVATELRDAREVAGQRLAAVVAALENIRLDLLRLQAGAGDTRRITEALAAASRIGASVDSVVAARSVGDVLPAG